MAATAPRRIGCAKSSRPTSISNRSASVDPGRLPWRLEAFEGRTRCACAPEVSIIGVSSSCARRGSAMTTLAAGFGSFRKLGPCANPSARRALLQRKRAEHEGAHYRAAKWKFRLDGLSAGTTYSQPEPGAQGARSHPVRARCIALTMLDTYLKS